MLENEMGVQDEIYVMPLSSEQEQNMEAILSSVHNMLENEMDVQDEIYVMPLSSEQEQKMEAILSSVTYVLSMLIMKIT
jgi:hypothetical protein